MLINIVSIVIMCLCLQNPAVRRSPVTYNLTINDPSLLANGIACVLGNFLEGGRLVSREDRVHTLFHVGQVTVAFNVAIHVVCLLDIVPWDGALDSPFLLVTIFVLMFLGDFVRNVNHVKASGVDVVYPGAKPVVFNGWVLGIDVCIFFMITFKDWLEKGRRGTQRLRCGDVAGLEQVGAAFDMSEQVIFCIGAASGLEAFLEDFVRRPRVAPVHELRLVVRGGSC
ncbi:hypothetical protein L7F22_058286 [Adiantum nelumboides]|nr:hypothetical protein [Adiantum nelumboides]